MHLVPNILANVLIFEDYFDCCSYLMKVFLFFLYDNARTILNLERVLPLGTTFT